ncbi:hypothetical protein IKP85_04915 [bacterium]|nr:hypothetical protein [bacterium]
MTRLTNPNLTIPASFAENGQKSDFTSEKIQNGFNPSEPDILAGDNLNKFIDDTYKGLNYSIGSIADLYGSVLWYDSAQNYSLNALVFGRDNNNEIGLYLSLQNNNLNNPLSDDEYWSKTPLGGSGSGRNIGELVYSLLPQQDACLHLADGALLQGDGIYSQFVDYIKNLYLDNFEASFFATETSWQEQVSSYGVCAKFVYNESENTVRLPKVTGLVEGTIDENALGSLMRAGLPALSGTTSSSGAHTHSRGTMNIKGRMPGENYDANNKSWWDRVDGAFYRKNTDNSHRGNGDSDNDNCDIYFDASRNWTGSTSSNGSHTHTVNVRDSYGVVGRSNTVQPQTVRGFLYIVTGTSVQNNIQIDINQISADLANKVDKDFRNITWTNQMREIVANVVGNGLINQIATEDVQGIVMPDNVTIQVSENGELSTIADPNDYYTKTEVDAKVLNLYKFKGTVESYNNLPQDNLVNGDVYNVKDTGKNYAWVGVSQDYPDGWDVLGGIFDLSQFYTKSETDEQIREKNTQIANLSAQIISLQNRMTALETLIDGGNAND